MEEQLEQSKQRLHFCMAVIGGWFGAYMVLRFGHFASAATVNLLEMLTGAAQENWPLALLRLGGILVYIAAIFLTAWLPRRTHSDLRRWAILIDMAAAAILSLIPADREYAVYFSLFAMAPPGQRQIPAPSCPAALPHPAGRVPLASAAPDPRQ